MKDDNVQLALSPEMREAWVQAATRCGYSSLAAFVRDAVNTHISTAGMGDLLNDLEHSLPSSCPESVMHELFLDAQRGLADLQGTVPFPRNI